MARLSFGRQGWRRLVAAIALVAFIAGCTTTQAVDPLQGDSLVGRVAPEDRVRIVTTDGRVLAFEVVTVEPDAVIGAGVRVERDEIAELEVTKFSPARTAGLVGGTGLTAAAIAFIIVVAIAPALILAAAAP